MVKTASGEKREKLKEQFFNEEEAWTGDKEKGWFRAPRTLPLILDLLSSKELCGKVSPAKVYLELLSRHFDGGIVEINDEGSHAYASGYTSTRSVRTWQERMKQLEKIGFIKTTQIGNQRYKYVLLVHPTVVIEKLRKEGKIDQTWYNTYRARQIEVKEDSFEDREKKKGQKVVPLIRKKAVNE